MEHGANQKGNQSGQRETATRKIWLNYYNNYLYEHHAITEDEKRKMQQKIERQGGRLER